MRYEFDSVGNILGTENEQKRGGKTYRTSQSYEYDDLYQLTSGNGTYYNGMYNRTTTYGQTYAYDDIGNMTGKTSVKRVDNITKTDGLTYGYSYVYDSVHPHRIASIGEVKYKYDDNGNILKKYREIQNDAIEATEDVNPGNSDNEAYGYNWDESGSKEQIIEEYTWDDDNRLKRAKVNGRTSYYLYNAGGERTAKKEENGDESLYADKTYQVKVNMSRDCITKHIFVGDTRIASRVTFNDLTHSDNEEIRGVYYYHPDHLGNTTFVSDYRGEEYQHLEYTPYGETWVEENTDSNKYINYKFTGKELDEETGLYYFGARYYDSKTSVFISADPIYDGVKEGFGVYTYCRNNPLKYTDPTGLETKYDGSELRNIPDSVPKYGNANGQHPGSHPGNVPAQTAKKENKPAQTSKNDGDKFADPFKEGTHVSQEYDGTTSHLPYKGQTWGDGVDIGSGGNIWEITWTGPDADVSYQSKDYEYKDKNGKMQKTPYGNNARVNFTTNGVKYLVLFAHMHDKTDLKNRKIKNGDTVGFMGWSGHCIPNGPNGLHTHMEVHKQDPAVDKTMINVNPNDYFNLK